MARTQSKNFYEIRESILVNAAELFAKKGYATTSIGDLATACKSSRGALYHYFESKEDILFQIINSHVDKLLSTIVEFNDLSLSAEANFRSLVKVMVVSNAGSQPKQIVLLNDLEQLDSKQQTIIVDVQRRIIGILTDTLVRLDNHNRLTTANSKAYTMMLLGMINYTFTWYDPKGSITPEEYAQMTADTFLLGFNRA